MPPRESQLEHWVALDEATAGVDKVEGCEATAGVDEVEGCEALANDEGVDDNAKGSRLPRNCGQKLPWHGTSGDLLQLL